MAFLMAEGNSPLTADMLLKRWNGPHRLAAVFERERDLSIGDIMNNGPNAQHLYDPAVRSVFINMHPNQFAKLRV
jgi:hypothetical protein